MTLRALLYDAHGEDRELTSSDGIAIPDADDQLLWLDLDSRDADALREAADLIGLEPVALRRLAHEGRKGRLLRLPDRIVLTLGVVEPDDAEVHRHELDIVVGANHVVTVHDGRISAVDEFREELADEDIVGRLDAGSFTTGLIDSVFNGFFRQLESIERDIDGLDELALRAREEDEFLSAVLTLRRRIARLRRILAPNREAILPLERPDVVQTSTDVGPTWPGIVQRFERAIDGVENARELLVGSFDLYLGRSSQRTNDVMKILTIISAMALPGVVLAGVMGMNFKLGFFDEPSNFFVVAAAMLAFALLIVVIARRQRWL